MRRILFLCFVICQMFIMLAPAHAQQVGLARHKRIFLVPRPGKVVIDGKLNDWDLSGQIQIWVTQQTADMQSLKFAMMYDDKALYISGDMRDTSPMMNVHDPLVDPHMAWDADCLQVRFMLDPKAGYPYYNDPSKPNDQLITCNAWYYTAGKEACLQIGSGGNLVGPVPRPQWPKGVVPHQLYQAAYLMASDKMGNIFEYRIPWSTLGSTTVPKAGDILTCNVQFDWSTPDGMHSGGSGWAYDVMNGPGFPFQSAACWGKAIFSEKGHLPKAMVEEGVKPLPPLPLRFTYDLPADGDVTVALKDANGQFVRHLVVQAPRKQGKVIEKWDGLDDVGKPLPAGAYTWEGIYHDPIKTKYLLSLHNSGKPAYPTPDGTGGWGGDHSNPTTVCAADDTHMLLAWWGGEAGWGLLRTDLNGKRQWGIREGGDNIASDGQRIFIGGGSEVRVHDMKDGRPINFEGGRTVLEEFTKPAATVTGLAYGNGVLYVTYQGVNSVALFDAKTGSLKESWNCPTPERLALTPEGKVLAISSGKILSVSKDAATLLITDHLDHPVSIATDAVGSIYVANCGALQNVSVFDAAGKFLRAIGKAGGRPAIGDYDKAGILEPGGIAVDKAGKLWVAETLDSPKRISVWNTKTGDLLNEFFGGSEYATFVAMDPKHEDEAFCHDVIWQIDLNAGTWYPKSTMWRSLNADSPGRPFHPAGTGPGEWVFTAANGKQYSFTTTPCTIFRRDGNVFKPIVQFNQIYQKKAPYPALADLTQYPDGSRFAWQDLNDDQRVQGNEVTKVDDFFAAVDANLNIYSSFGKVYRPIEIAANGQPRYDFSKPEILSVNAAWSYMSLAPDGSFYSIGGQNKDGVKGSGFVHWGRDGALLWNYRKVGDWHSSLDKPIPKPGEIPGFTRILGTAGDFTGLASYQGPFSILTTDGLFVAQLFKDGRLGESGPETICAEAFAGQLVKLEKSGRILFLGGDQDGRITEILGLDTLKQFAGQYTLTADEMKQAQIERDEYARIQAKAQPLVIVRGKPALAVAQGVGKSFDDTRDFTARLAYDEKNLYVAYTVNSPAELTNNYADWKTIFKGGNCLDLQLAADPAADPKRKEPATGDVRILITRQNGKAVAVIYRPKVKGFTGEPNVFVTVNRAVVDVIEQSDQVQLMEYRKTPTGFTATVSIPLEVLGWTPKPGSTVKLDLGYLYGNATGNQVAARSYWSNNSFSANVTGDVPNEIKLEPDQWGSAVIE